MSDDLLAALALVLVLEGILPFLSPDAVRRLWSQMSALDNRSMRIAGFVSMIAGLLLLMWVKKG